MKKTIYNILRNTNVNFLLGAGASKFQVDKPFPLMNDLLKLIVEDEKYKEYKELFKCSCFNETIKQILNEFFESDKKNIEEGISKLEGLVPYSISDEFTKNLNNFITWIKGKIIQAFDDCSVNESAEKMGEFYFNLVQMNNEKISPLRRLNIFTTNYDMLSEIALENKDIYYYSGFSGLCKRKFNLALYNYQYSENIGLIKRDKNSYISQINLYKIHGSFSWIIDNESNELIEIQNYKENKNPVIIYPSSAKYYSTNLITYYSAMFREFSNQIIKENSSLVVIGSGLNDDHINKIICDALALPTFTLIVLAYCQDDSKKNEIEKDLKEKFGERGNVIIDISSENTIEKLTKSLFNGEIDEN